MTNYLTDDQRVLGLRADAFADEFIDPILEDLDRGLVYPRTLIGQLAEYGFMGLVLPDEAGIAGAGFIGHIQVVAALSRSCAGIGSILNSHALVSYAIATWGTAAQTKQYLPDLAKGKKLAALAIQQDDPIQGFKGDGLFARGSRGGFILNGSKMFVRNAGAADVYLVFARSQPEAEGNRLTAFLIEAGARGLTIGPRLDTMGLKVCPVAHVTCKNAWIAETAMLGELNQGSAIAAQVLAVAAVAQGAQTIGIARAAIAHAAAYANHRMRSQQPIAALQAIQTLLAEIATDCHMGWLGVQDTAHLIENEAPFEREAAMVKLFLGQLGSRILIDAVQVEGGLGISEVVPRHITFTAPLARMFRDIAGTTLLDAPDDFPDRLIAAGIT
jgi:butyryl-CoA dehydrogenase